MRYTASVELFLHYLKSFVRNRSFVLVDREANRDFMASRGMSMNSLTDIILSLRPEECFDGREPDRDPRFAANWTVAEFCSSHCGEDIYLKMSIRIDVKRAKCLSVKAFIEKRGTDE